MLMLEWKFYSVCKYVTRNILCQSKTNISSLSFKIKLSFWIENIINQNFMVLWYKNCCREILSYVYENMIFNYYLEERSYFCNQTKVKRMILGLDISYLQSMHFNFEINYPFIILLSKNTPIRNSNVCEWKRVNDHS